MSLPTPTGNPYPFPPGHPFYTAAVNLQWIQRERLDSESDMEVVRRIAARAGIEI